MDFAAWLEAYVGDRWYTFDPRNNQRRTGRVVDRPRPRRARRRHAHQLRAGAAGGDARGRRAGDRDARGRAPTRRCAAPSRTPREAAARRRASTASTTPWTTTGVDTSAVDWSRVRRGAYVIQQSITYQYEGPVHRLRQRLVVQPREHHGDQRRVSRRVEVVDATPRTVRAAPDDFGNHVVDIEVPYVAEQVTFLSSSVVERRADQRAPRLRGAAPRPPPARHHAAHRRRRRPRRADQRPARHTSAGRRAGARGVPARVRADALRARRHHRPHHRGRGVRQAHRRLPGLRPRAAGRSPAAWGCPRGTCPASCSGPAARTRGSRCSCPTAPATRA